jgi:hypothetical protein
MSHSRWRRTPALLLLPAAVTGAGVGLGGCGGPGGHAAAPVQSGTIAQAGPFTSAELRGALLAKVNGVSAAVPPEAGNYAQLPEVRAATQSRQGVAVTPKACAQAALTGFNSAALASAPAAAITFRLGGNGVAEVLVAASDPAAASALGGRVPAMCDHYAATVEGKTFQYTVSESAVSGIGEQARMLNVTTAGYPSDDIWSLVYRGSGFVGAVTVVGPNASDVAVRELGRQAYAYAAKSLA